MKHVPKKEWMGCAVATAAMLADLTYEEVAGSRLNLDIARMRDPNEFCSLLKNVTNTEWRVTSGGFGRRELSRFSFPQWPVAVFHQDSPYFPRSGQWIVVKTDIVHDPGGKTVYTVRSYPHRDWHIAWIAQPVRPLEFARNQARRRMDTIRHVLEMEGLSPAKPGAGTAW